MNKIRSFFRWVRSLPKKILIPAIILLAILLFFIFRPKPAETLQFAIVKRQDIQSTVSASGVLTGKDTVNLRFLQGGKVASINVKVNERVTKGQVIAILDTQALSIALNQAENTLTDKQAALEKVLDDIHLFQYGNGGFSNVGTANETETQRQLRVNAEQTKNNAVEGVNAAKRNFQDAVLISPIDGIVTQANVLSGQVVGASDIVAQVIDDSDVIFNADVDEADTGKISINQVAEITIDTFPDKLFKGSVQEILPQTKTTSTNATVVTTKIRIDGVEKFIAGLNGQASIITNSANAVLTIPIEALRLDNTIVVQKAGELKIVPVKIGIESETDIEITEGLSEGEKVVLNPPADLPGRQQNPFSPVLRLFRRGR